ncbi:DEAD/DEAH box helicase [Brevibacillus borstelensis]|uniref:DEAD/DEAH box helicase n=1 Tax=Brevibacillus borstelensis TaxID=45462 RepID=UPI00148F7CC3|nr:DEAD/DEAH box helicase [Brevibacillus borstelensis]NOU57218.1 DEAD/DEAH box helicase [Brevibacillus borstelensis]
MKENTQPSLPPISIPQLIKDTGITEFVLQAEEESLVRDIARNSHIFTQKNIERLPRLGFLFERQAVDEFELNKTNRTVKDNFLLAFRSWRSMINLPSTQNNQSDISRAALELIEKELSGEPLPAEIILAFRIAVSGLMSDRPSETRLELKKFNFQGTNYVNSWGDKVRITCFLSFIYLCRKKNGWEDVDKALEYIDELKELQKEYEDTYLNRFQSGVSQIAAAYELVGYYNLAQIITITGQYLKTGSESISRISDRLDRYKDQALEAFGASGSVFMRHLTELMWAGCWKLANNSIWTHVNVLGETPRNFAKMLSDKGRPNPVIELWPSQQDALRKNLLDPYRRAILVEMPTSAGKTLLAKFSIIQTKALNPNGKIMYIVPTRALVNQVTADLRQDFANFNPKFVVEQAVPAFELNPTEERLLSGETDILVTTPEKLDLLIRKDHPVTKDIALVIADEAHNISDRSRGARLELLLGTLKRERAGARFLLLSPFLPNDNELVTWLGDDQALPPIGVDWKPSRTVVGVLKLDGSRDKRAFILETVPASKALDISPGRKIRLADKDIVQGRPSLERYTIAGAKVFNQRGAVLVLCRGRGTALKRAKQIASTMESINENNELVKSVCRFLAVEQGPNTPLIKLLYKGVAYHHSGLSQEARLLIEGLIKRDLIKVVCGTTTLAQGVNFPISTVIIESLVKGSGNRLTYSDFWNVAGRAGRALVDTTGIITFPAPDADTKAEILEFLQGEAEEISSQLSNLIHRADEIADKFNLNSVKKWPELSSLMQFLAHALKVAGETDLAGEIEDLLRASLVYHQSKKLGVDAPKKLLKLCRDYLDKIKGKKGLVQIADQTGFATPSVLKILAEKQHFKDLSKYEDWKPENLFSGDVTPLTRRIEAIADLPEIQLGRGKGQPFNAREVATILKEWVNGERLDIMAERHPINNDNDPGTREAEFGKYLFSNLIGKASWGIGALEGIYLSQIEKEKWDDVGYVPSMIYFGVSSKEAVWFRMVGAPRFVAKGLAELWKSQVRKEPDSHEQIRKWIDNLDDEQWKKVLPKNVDITPSDIKKLWNELMI